MEALPPHIQAIGGIPVCGKETFGFESADANLYYNATFVLTPLARTLTSTLTLVQSLASALGAHPICP